MKYIKSILAHLTTSREVVRPRFSGLWPPKTAAAARPSNRLRAQGAWANSTPSVRPAQGRPPRLAAFLCLAALLSGCAAPFTAEDIRIAFPEPPAAVRELFGEPAWRLEYSEGGSARTAFSPAGKGSLSLRLSGAAAVPIAGYMVFGGRHDLFLPAGCLWPHDAGSSHSLTLDWEKGFAAQLLIRLSRQGYPVSAFNAGRFFKETVARGAGNPWALDEELIITTLAGLSFRADRIKLLPAHAVSLALPPGKWQPRNPLAPIAETNADGICVFGSLAEGYHRYYRTGTAGSAGIQVKSASAVLHTITDDF